MLPLFLLALVSGVAGLSSGDVELCTIDAKFGCEKWIGDKPVDRKMCIDDVPGIMYWAAAPVRSDDYSLRSGTGGNRGNDPKSYRPGEIVRIYIEVLHREALYRGLMMYAENAAGQQVGEFVFPPSDQLFWSPTNCEKSVALQVNGAIKPILTYLLWKAPPKNTGKVTFRALIKKGLANHGFFYWPNLAGDLTLEEGSVNELPRPQWVIADPKQSCTDACEAEGSTCQASKFADIDSPNAVHREISPLVACNLPFLSGCGASDPRTVNKQSMCSFADQSCPASRTPATPTCDGAYGDTRRFCPCSAPVPPPTQAGTPPTAPPPVESKCRLVQCGDNGDCDEATALCKCKNGHTGDFCQNGPQPSCVDGKKNGQEEGIDCGGSCPACAEYTWVATMWSKCTKSCGTGTRTRTIQCMDRNENEVDAVNCKGAHEEPTEEPCNPELCPLYTWQTSEWSMCSQLCGSGEQQRTLKCFSSIGNSLVLPTQCTADKPETSRACNTQACDSFFWKSYPFAECSASCGGGVQQRPRSDCFSKDGVKQEDLTLCGEELETDVNIKTCNHVPCPGSDSWTACDFDACTKECDGAGTTMSGSQNRLVLCTDVTGKSVDQSRCDAALKPAPELFGCNQQRCTSSNWMTTVWSPCDADGLRHRTSHCHTVDGANALDSDCDPNTRPLSSMRCGDRICPSKDIVFSSTPGSRVGGDRTQIISGASRPHAMAMIPLLTLASLFMIRRNQISTTHLFLIALLGGASFCEAHNWMWNLGRTQRDASTTSPCKPRAGNKINMQVGKNQPFSVAWSAGHTGDHLISVIKGEEYSKLKSAGYKNDVMDYIKGAAAAGVQSKGATAQFQRYRGTSKERGDKKGPDPNMEMTPMTPAEKAKYWNNPLIKETTSSRVMNGLPPWKNFLKYPMRVLSKDPHVSYQSAKYPHIEFAGQYTTETRFGDKDSELIHIAIPGFNGVGHYIIFWQWSGFTECVDVEVRQTATMNPYGSNPVDAKPTYSLIKQDHCQFIGYEKTLSKCFDASQGAKACLNSIDIGSFQESDVIGFNVVKAKNPALVPPAFDNVNLGDGQGCAGPWNDNQYVCYAVKGRPGVILPVPEEPFEISLDPRNPVFYSSCYMRDKVAGFEPLEEGAAKGAKLDWLYYDQCLTCGNRDKNQNLKATSDKQFSKPFRKWAMAPANKCYDCDGEGSNPSPTPRPTPRPGTPTARPGTPTPPGVNNPVRKTVCHGTLGKTCQCGDGKSVFFGCDDAWVKSKTGGESVVCQASNFNNFRCGRPKTVCKCAIKP